VRPATTHTTNSLTAYLAYRFHFNGKETDNEVYGEGNALDFGARIYNSRLGRWLSLDPQFKSYPDYSAYCYSLNSPLKYGDPTGQWVEEKVSRYKIVNGQKVQLKGLFSYLVKADIIEKQLIIHQAKIIDLTKSLTSSEMLDAARTIEADITEKWTTSSNKDLNVDENGYITNKRGQQIKVVTTFAEPITVVTDRIPGADASVPNLGSGIMYVDKNEISQPSLPAHEFGHWGHLNDLLLGGNKEKIMYNKSDRKGNNYPEANEYKSIKGSGGVSNPRVLDLNESL
jgi:RHS repeat-associated protein